MIDIKLIREDPDVYRQAAKVKGFDVDIDELLTVDKQLLDARRKLQAVKTAQNTAGKEIAKLQGPDKQPAVAKMGELKDQAKKHHEKIEQLEPRFQKLMLCVPQIPAPEVPLGEDETDNVEIRRVGAVSWPGRTLAATPKHRGEIPLPAEASEPASGSSC